MKNRLNFSILIILIFSLFLFGCSSNSDEQEKGYNPGDETEGVTTDVNDSRPDRKIIYTVNAKLSTNDLAKSVASIKSELHSDEWLDSEEISDERANLVIRVKTERLDDFLNAIEQNHHVTDFNKKATDISLTYQDKSNQVLTYQAEQERLLDLYDEASLSEMIMINSRLSEIDVEIRRLQGELNQFDSLVDYSEVTITLYAQNNRVTLPFGERIVNAFVDGFMALVVFLEIVVIVVAALVPWILVTAPVAYGVYRVRKHTKKKKLSNKSTPKE